MLETLGQIVGLTVCAFVVFWAGFFTCAMLKVAGHADREAEHEHIRKVEP